MLALPAIAGVKVEKVDYLGWKDAIEINNGEVKLIVVPAIGRIMHYSYLDGDNILWSDPQFHGKVLPKGIPNIDEIISFCADLKLIFFLPTITRIRPTVPLERANRGMEEQK